MLAHHGIALQVDPTDFATVELGSRVANYALGNLMVDFHLPICVCDDLLAHQGTLVGYVLLRCRLLRLGQDLIPYILPNYQA